jgi:hypothetical protein
MKGWTDYLPPNSPLLASVRVALLTHLDVASVAVVINKQRINQ